MFLRRGQFVASVCECLCAVDFAWCAWNRQKQAWNIPALVPSWTSLTQGNTVHIETCLQILHCKPTVHANQCHCMVVFRGTHKVLVYILFLCPVSKICQCQGIPKDTILLKPKIVPSLSLSWYLHWQNFIHHLVLIFVYSTSLFI